jgi:hypothetical protein
MVQTFDPRRASNTPSHLERVINAIDETVSFEIGAHPGSPVSRFRLRPGEEALLPKNYCERLVGANPNVTRDSILAQLASREAYPGGPVIQAVVPLRDAESTAKAWRTAQATRPATATVVLQDNRGRGIPVEVPIPQESNQASDDDDDDDIEEPPPGVEDLRAIASQSIPEIPSIHAGGVTAPASPPPPAAKPAKPAANGKPNKD